VRCGKRDKDRRTVLPSSLVEPLKGHMQGAVVLPHALERKYRNAAREWGWQGCFPRAVAGGICATRGACSRAGCGDQQTWWRSFHREVFQARKTMPLLPSQPRDLKQWLGETDPSGITDLDQLCSNYDPAP